MRKAFALALNLPPAIKEERQHRASHPSITVSPPNQCCVQISMWLTLERERNSILTTYSDKQMELSAICRLHPQLACC